MNELVIRIHMNNAAFADSVVGDSLPLEAARILRDIASDIDSGERPTLHHWEVVRDIKGNVCGKWTVK